LLLGKGRQTMDVVQKVQAVAEAAPGSFMGCRCPRQARIKIGNGCGQTIPIVIR